MPLIEIETEQAFENRKNIHAKWGSRHEKNRVEPLACPNFDVPFHLIKGEKIFTIGSCFARNVESELRNRGFSVPPREMFDRPEFKDMDPAIINNFGVPSIFNEFSWALDPSNPYNEDMNFAEVSAGKFVDLHTVTSEKPMPREALAMRRRAITEVNRSVRDCRVVIMTLGLTELWFDRQQGIYLNAAPHPRVVAREPERFALHVLSYEESLDFMNRALDLLKQHARPDQQIILTVSPVPLMMTLRPIDVMVANSYSKSCLRTVAETICYQRDNVHYFPSYESVTLSDRKIAWADDLVHVTKEIVRFNITRMVKAYVPEDEGFSALRAELEAGNTLTFIEESEKFAKADKAEGLAFFDTFSDQAAHIPSFAANAAAFFNRWRLFDRTEEFLKHIPSDWNPAVLALLTAQLQESKGEWAAVEATVAPFLRRGERNLMLWRLYTVSKAKRGLVHEARVAANDWIKAMPRYQYTAHASLADALRDEHPQAALASYDLAFAVRDPDRVHLLGWIECLIRAEQYDRARTELSKLTPEHRTEGLRLERLRNMLPAETT